MEKGDNFKTRRFLHYPESLCKERIYKFRSHEDQKPECFYLFEKSSLNQIQTRPNEFGSMTSRKRRYKATVLQRTRPNMATQDHKRPQKIIQGHIAPHKAMQGHKRPYKAIYEYTRGHIGPQ